MHARWLLLVAVALPASAQQRQAASRLLHSAAIIRIDNPAGSVRLVGWDKDSVTVTAMPGATDQRLMMSGTGDSVSITIRGSTTARADLELRVPARSQLWIRTATGEIDADQLAGSVTALTVSGRLRVGGAVATATVESLEGNIEVAADAATATARAGSGSIVFRGSIQSATATSVSGALLIGLTGPLQHGRFESLSGNVSYKGPLTPDGTLELQSHSGDIDLRMAPTLGARYDIETVGGTVREELSAATPRTLKGNTVFTVGNGQAQVVVRNFKGLVTILRQETLGARQ